MILVQLPKIAENRFTYNVLLLLKSHFNLKMIKCASLLGYEPISFLLQKKTELKAYEI